MMALEVHVVLMVVGALTAAAGWLVSFRPDARAVGRAFGMVLVGVAMAAVAWGPRDAVVVPRIGFGGLGLIVVFSVLPRRQANARLTAKLVLLTVVQIGLVLSPVDLSPASVAGPVGLWLASCWLTWSALGERAAQRLAAPYLLLAAVAGVAGLVVDGLVLYGNVGSLLLVMAVAVRLGVFPFHSWVVGAYTLAPTTVAVAISAPMACIALVARHPMPFEGIGALALLGGLALGAMLTAALAIVAREFVRGVALLTVSVQSLVLLGVLDADHIGHLGGLIMWSITGLALLGIGLVAAALRSRLGALSLDTHLGLAQRAPTFAVFFLLFGLCAIGAPGTADFVSEDLVLHGGLAHHPWLLLAYLCAVSVQAYAVLHLFYRAFFGPPAPVVLTDALWLERFALGSVAVGLIAAGLAPQLLVNGFLP